MILEKLGLELKIISWYYVSLTIQYLGSQKKDLQFNVVSVLTFTHNKFNIKFYNLFVPLSSINSIL